MGKYFMIRPGRYHSGTLDMKLESVRTGPRGSGEAAQQIGSTDVGNVGRALLRAQGSLDTRELTLEKDPTNVMSVGKPSVAVLGSLITKESTIYRSGTTVKSVERPSARAQV